MENKREHKCTNTCERCIYEYTKAIGLAEKFRSQSPSDVSEWEKFESGIDMFYNEVVESVTRYIKGKSYGQDPEAFLKEQLAHWEGNFKGMLNSFRNETLDEAAEAIDRKTGAFYQNEREWIHDAKSTIRSLKK